MKRGISIAAGMAEKLAFGGAVTEEEHQRIAIGVGEAIRAFFAPRPSPPLDIMPNAISAC